MEWSLVEVRAPPGKWRRFALERESRKPRAERDGGMRDGLLCGWGVLGDHWLLSAFTLQLKMKLGSRSLTWERTSI